VTIAYVRTITMFIIEYLVGTNLAFKNIFLEKLFGHLLLKDVLPPYFQDLQKMKTNQNLVNSFKYSLTSHLVGAKSSQITMAKDIVYTLATSHSRKVGKVSRVDRRNIRRVAKRRQLLDSFGVAFWTSHQRVKVKHPFKIDKKLDNFMVEYQNNNLTDLQRC
jgi:hypothetical protein